MAEETKDVVNRLAEHAMEYAHQRGCAKDESHVLLPVVDRLGRFTHAYKRWMTISELVVESVRKSKETRNDLWLSLFSSCATALRVPNIVREVQCPDLVPQYHPQQRWFSFANGLFDTETVQFYPRDNPNIIVPVDTTAHIFIDHDFDPTPRDRWMAEVRDALEPLLVADVIGIVDVYARHETVVERLWRAHRYGDEAIAWCWAWLARGCLFVNGIRDNWQRTLLVTGPEDARNLMFHLIRSLISPERLGYMPAYIEPYFALSHIYDKFAYVAPQVNEKWCNITVPTLRSMNRRKPMTVSGNYRPATELPAGWTCPGVWLGTAVPEHITKSAPGEFVVLSLTSPATSSIDMEDADRSAVYAELDAELAVCIREMTLNYHRLSAAFPGDRDDGLDWFEFHLAPAELGASGRSVGKRRRRRSQSPDRIVSGVR